MWIKNAKEIAVTNERKLLMSAFSHSINELAYNSYKKDLICETRDKAKNKMMANNDIACKAMESYFKGRDPKCEVNYLGPSKEGYVVDVATDITEYILQLKDRKQDKTPWHVTFGQKDIHVKLAAIPAYGGKTLELGLLIGLMLKGDPDVTIICGKTNGKDGTAGRSAAGMIFDHISYEALRGINVKYYVENSESYAILKLINSLIVTGETKVEKSRIFDAIIT